MNLSRPKMNSEMRRLDLEIRNSLCIFHCRILGENLTKNCSFGKWKKNFQEKENYNAVVTIGCELSINAYYFEEAEKKKEKSDIFVQSIRFFEYNFFKLTPAYVMYKRDNEHIDANIIHWSYVRTKLVLHVHSIFSNAFHLADGMNINADFWIRIITKLLHIPTEC